MKFYFLNSTRNIASNNWVLLVLHFPWFVLWKCDVISQDDSAATH